MAEYVILLRDPRTLALLGELPRYQAASWSRRAEEAGECSVTAYQGQLGVDIPRYTILDVRRDGDPEFAGVILNRRYDAIEEVWTFTGPDLSWWLAGREVVPAGGQEFDAVSAVPAETAMKGYIARQMTAPTDASRDIDSELDGITFVTAADQGRGTTVTFNGRFANLWTGCLVPLGRSGGLWQAVGFQPNYAGYEHEVHEWRDATTLTGAVPVVFSTGWGNVGQLTYEENAFGLANAIYVLGQGEGAARTVLQVINSTSIAADFRRERSADSRNNASGAALAQDGQIVIDQALAAMQRLDAQPLPVGPTLYRDAWDLGDEVTIALPEIGGEADRRIVEVAITLDAQQGETVSIALGSTARTLPRLIGAALQKLNRVQVA